MTAIEWLYNEIKHIIPNDFLNKFEEAKEMEKKQMCDFFREGYMWCNSPSLRIENGEIVTSTLKYGEFYYEKKFNKNHD